MTRLRAAAFGSTLVLAFAVSPQGCTKRLPHGGTDPLYDLKGRHDFLPCEGSCHGSGKPKALPTSCLACHVNDAPPGHDPGECFPCHTEFGWGVAADEPTAETGSPPIVETGVDPVVEHPPVADGDLCWDCHAEARRVDELGIGSHWFTGNASKSWDCGPCHTLSSWADDTYFFGPGDDHPFHPVRTPHGTQDDLVPTNTDDWVVSCVPCHREEGVFTAYQCTESCHLDDMIFPHWLAPQRGPVGDATCMTAGCHENGDPTTFW